MYYTVYADVMLITGFISDIIVLYTAGIFMRVKPRLLRVITASLAGSTASLTGYLLLYNSGFLIQIIFYAVVFIFITWFVFRPENANKKELAYKSVFLSLTCIGGLLTIIIRRPHTLWEYIALCLPAGIAICLIYNSLKSCVKSDGYYHAVTIYYNDMSYDFTAFMDSGNLLKSPYTGAGVIIADKSLMKTILPPCFESFTDTYMKSGRLDYIELLRKNHSHGLLPVSYSLINGATETMPAIICDRVIIDKGAAVLTKIPLCFSRMSFGKKYKLLLGKDLI